MIPHGTLFYIKNLNQDKVLATKNNRINYQQLVNDDASQLWKKGKVNDDGYFVLSNSKSQKFLTAFGKILGITGMYN